MYKATVVNVVLSVANTPLQMEDVSCVTTFQMHVSVFLNTYFYCLLIYTLPYFPLPGSDTRFFHYCILY